MVVDERSTGAGASGLDVAELRHLARSLNVLLGDLHRLAGQDQTDGGLAGRIGDHLGADPRSLAVVTQELPPYQLVDVQVALDAWPTVAAGRETTVIGVSGDQRRFHPLSELLRGSALGVGVGPVDYVDLADSPDSTRSCVRFGVFLVSDGDQRAAVLMRGADPHGPMQQAMLEVVAADPAFGRDLMAELRWLAVERSVLRGQVIGLGVGDGQQYGALRFVHRPVMTRDQLVLPAETFAQVERHVMGIAAHSERLLAAGQHLKRGVLLYGPPGTGKTHTVRFLLSQLPEVTAFILSGQALGMIGLACTMARLLQPSVVILEDVDLIAPDRSFGPVGGHPLLFEVLNQIDGLGDDVDVTFVLTTNRVDILERALSERPGRVDAAVEIAPPDAEGRVRLFHLYGGGLGIDQLSADDIAGAVDATDGRTATYLREVVRRAALIVAESQPTGALQVDGAALLAAASELLDDRAALTRALLGGPEEPDAQPPVGGPPPFPGGRPMGAMIRPPGVQFIGGFRGAAPQPDTPPFAPDQ